MRTRAQRHLLLVAIRRVPDSLGQLHERRLRVSDAEEPIRAASLRLAAAEIAQHPSVARRDIVVEGARARWCREIATPTLHVPPQDASGRFCFFVVVVGAL